MTNEIHEQIVDGIKQTLADYLSRLPEGTDI